jgi:Cu-Zn family superoxide dismutase
MTIKHALKWAATALFVAGCASMGGFGSGATAKLAPTAGNAAAGTVTFTPNGDRVRVVAQVSGLTSGAHGFHVHEKGDCSAPDATSAGGHFNPGASRTGIRRLAHITRVTCRCSSPTRPAMPRST